MKKDLTCLLLILTASSIIFSGCKKKDGVPTKIVEIFTTQKKSGTYVGTFEASGGINSSGKALMDVEVVGDSAYCLNKCVAPEGTFTFTMACSFVNNTGKWNITNGTGAYTFLRGGGSLVMTFPPGVLDVEIMTGKVWLNGF
jgi:hypothetical protein